MDRTAKKFRQNRPSFRPFFLPRQFSKPRLDFLKVSILDPRNNIRINTHQLTSEVYFYQTLMLWLNHKMDWIKVLVRLKTMIWMKDDEGSSVICRI
jgi:hypothetical protein